MMQNVRGTKDFIGAEIKLYNQIIDVSSKLASLYSYLEISTPILEYSSVFHRTLGESSDIISKETYTFDDREKRSLTLRPEFTAAIARAVISGGMTQNMPLKLFSHGPLFRHERPQRGRYRQFHQVNFEFLGHSSPFADAELIIMLQQLLNSLKLNDKVSLQINSIGDVESRLLYKEALTKYLGDFKHKLSEDSAVRLGRNILRILDSKNENDIEVLKGAPRILDYLNTSSRARYNSLLETLDSMCIKYTTNDKLVRGMDYYSHTVFEFTTSLLGAQSAVIAGGRYDDLMRDMGSKTDIPAVGAAAGIERIIELIRDDQESLDNNSDKLVSIVTIDQDYEGFKLATMLRGLDIKTNLIYSCPLKKAMKKAQNSFLVVIIGEDEVSVSKYKVKDMSSGQEFLVEFGEIASFIKGYC